MDAETIVYLSATSMIIVFVIAGIGNYGLLGIPVLVLGIAALIMIFALNFADFIVFPMITKSLNIEVSLSGEHKVPSSQSCIIKHVNGLYYATGYLTANVYKYVFSAESANMDEDQSLAAAPDKWERIIMNTKFPFRFNLVSMTEEVQKYRENLEGQRGFLEFQLSREVNAANPNQLTITELQRKINIVQTRIDRISGGELPTYSIMYIESTAMGVSEKEASDILTEQLNHLQTVFNTFDLSIIRIVGREIHALHSLNYRLMHMDELTKHFQTQN